MAEIELANGDRTVRISWLERGEGPAVLLSHGFASTKEVNWLNTNWIDRLQGAGHRVVAVDHRGHGASSRFHAADDYSLRIMAGDLRLVIEELGLQKPHVVGYSMGARIAAMLAIEHGEMISKLVLSGNGWGMVEGSRNWQEIRDALLSPRADQVGDRSALAFRIFADQNGADLKALAACATVLAEKISEQQFRQLANETLVAIGTRDEVAGSGEKLVNILPRASFLPIPNRDHMRAVGDRVHIAGVLEFLGSGN